ncbi:MAG: hypothetical protein ACRCXB_23550 [Aeromonadaceae bacterium]
MNLIEWIDSKGGIDLAAGLLKEQPRTVKSWYYGEKMPKPSTACKIVKLTKGVVDYNGIYGTCFALMAERQAKALIKKGNSNAQ